MQDTVLLFILDSASWWRLFVVLTSCKIQAVRLWTLTPRAAWKCARTWNGCSIVTKVKKLTGIIFSWICIFPDELAQRACWLSSLAIKAGNWSFLSFHTDEARRAAMSFHHWANSSQIYLSVSFEQKALASCHFIYFSLFVSFHSFTDRKGKKKTLSYLLGNIFTFASSGEVGLGGWCLAGSHWPLSGCSDFCRSSTLDCCAENSWSWGQRPQRNKKQHWDWPDFSVLQSHLAQMKRGKQSIFSILEIARNSEEV